MIKLSELKPGDLVMAEFDGKQWEGVVTELNREDKEICVETEVQEFWFTPDQLYPIPLDEQQLMKLQFQKQDTAEGVKYLKGPFRILLSQKGDFSDFEMWYREDRRHMKHPIAVHELQNHYRQMTKVELSQDLV